MDSRTLERNGRIASVPSAVNKALRQATLLLIWTILKAFQARWVLMQTHDVYLCAFSSLWFAIDAETPRRTATMSGRLC